MDLSLLYGQNYDQKYHENRLKKLINTFVTSEGSSPDFLFSSSGRAEILGNHTDHNHGLVMVSAISCDTIAVVKKNNTNTVKICSENYTPFEFSLSDLSPKQEELGKSISLARGVARAITDRGYKIGGFTAYTTSSIFKGAGVSSSASFEVLISEIFNYLYLNEVLSPIDKANISQYAENEYFGKPCGLLDQSGIAIGSLTKIDFNNPVNPVVTKLSAPKGYTLVITNTGGNHASLTKHYADIKSEMKEISNYFGKEFLRDVKYDEFEDNLPSLTSHFSSRAVLRAMHFFSECDRVTIAEAALKNNDASTFIDCINKSGLSSLCLLQNCCVPGDVNQPVVLGIEYSRSLIHDGAVRVHGGGFAGSILAFVATNEVNSYVSSMQKLFGENNVFVADFRSLGTTFVSEL